jgi:DNA-binding beta-propeller fold protein YncE
MANTVGQGDFRYELVEGWAQLPAGWRLGQVSPATDSQGRVYLFNRSEHPMIVLDRDGQFVEAWDAPELTSAHGMHVDDADNVYVAVMYSHIVEKFDPSGKLLLTLGTPDKPSNPDFIVDYNREGAVGRNPWDTPPQVRDKTMALSGSAHGPFSIPTDIAVGPDGSIYCSDGYGNCRVHKFSSDGDLLLSWGEPGRHAPGEFFVPHGIWAHRDGRVFVADRENNRVQIFDSEGIFLDQWRGFSYPCDVFIDDDDIVYVAEGTTWNPPPDPTAPCVQIRSSDGELLTRFSSPVNASGHRVWVDSEGSLYVNQSAYLLPEGQLPILKYRRVS